MNKFTEYVRGHKIRSFLGLFIVIIIGYFLFFKSSKTGQTQYALAQVTRGSIVTSVSGTGQVSADNQVTVKPKVSGTYIYVNPGLAGKKVAAGTLIAEIDPTTAAQAVRSDQLDLESAQLALEKLENDQTNTSQSNSDTLTNAQTALNKAYQDGFNDVASAFIHLPDANNDARLVLYGTSLSSYGCSPDYCAYDNLVDSTDHESLDSLISSVRDDYKTASDSYNQAFNDYKASSRTADSDSIVSLINETLTASQDLSQAIKDENTMLQTVVSDIDKVTGRSVPSQVTNYQTTLTTDLTNVNSQVSTLLDIQNTITTNQQTIDTTNRNISSSVQGNQIDIDNQQNIIAQKQATLDDAQTTLAEYYIRAPFAGIISSVDAQKGTDSSSSTDAAIIISPEQIVEISLNEVDVANVSIGQPVTLTFDAIPNLTLTGKVASIDTVGTVSQGVVSYTVKIALDAQDSRIKPGMSVSASIITNSKENVLEVPLSAIKNQSGQSYVQVINLPSSQQTSQATIASNVVPTPQVIPVTVGLESDTMAEITDGLQEGQTIITRTITQTSASTTAAGAPRAGSGNAGFFGGGGGGGGAVRVLGR